MMVMADREGRVVRIAELQIDPRYLDAYRQALAEEIDASLALEPGVLSLQAVSLTESPAEVRLLEIYASEAAYQSHLQTPHFLKYKAETAHMVIGLRLLPATPIRLQVDRAKP